MLGYLEIGGQWEGAQEEAEQQGHFETVLWVEGAAGDQEHAEDHRAQGDWPGQEDVPDK